MDVNKANAVSPIGQGGAKKDQKRGAEDDKQNNQQHSDDAAADGSPWADTEAFAVDGVLAGSLSPEAQEAFQGLAREIEPLRAELDRARGREAHFRELAEKHSFLPLPGRREFLRELAYVLNHMQHLTPPPSLLVLHLVNGDDIRRRFGRATLDGVLGHVCDSIVSAIHPTDIAGAIGGNDFGVVLLVGNADAAEDQIRRLADAVTGRPFTWHQQSVPLEVAAGIATLADAASPDAALAAADRNLLARLAGTTSGDDVG